MEDLPLEIIEEILSYVNGTDLLNCRKVNTVLQIAVDNLIKFKNIWKNCCLKEIADKRSVRDLIWKLDDHSNGFFTQFKGNWYDIYRHWNYLKKLDSLKCSVKVNKNIVKTIFQIKTHKKFLLCVHSKEILIFDKSGALLFIYKIKNQERISPNCYKTFLISFQSKEEFDQVQDILSRFDLITNIAVEIIDYFKCCTLTICFILYKNNNEVNDVFQKLTYLLYLSSSFRNNFNIHSLDFLWHMHDILDIDLYFDNNLLIIRKDGEISMLNLHNNSLNSVEDHIFIPNLKSTEIKFTIGLGWFYKNNLFQTNCLLLYSNLLILGSKQGSLYVYYFENIDHLKKMNLQDYLWHRKVTNDPIRCLDVCLFESHFIILASTNYVVYHICFQID